MFAGTPTTYDAAGATLQGEGKWIVKGSDVRRGDRAAIFKWKGRDKWRGIVGFCEVLSDPVLEAGADDGYYVNGGGHLAQPARRVRVRYVSLARLPLLDDGDPESPVSALSVVRATGGSVFKVSSDAWLRLVAAAGGWPQI